MTTDAAWAEVQHDLKAAQARLAQLEAEDDVPPWSNRAYPVNIKLPLTDSGVAFGQFSIEDGKSFFVKGIEAHYQVTGVLSEDEVTPATLNIPETTRTEIFDYTWMMRDSGTKRDWGNVPLPSALFRSGNTNGLWFGRGQARMRGGSVVTVTINPTFFDATSDASGLTSITSHSLQVIVTGIAVREDFLK